MCTKRTNRTLFSLAILLLCVNFSNCLGYYCYQIFEIFFWFAVLIQINVYSNSFGEIMCGRTYHFFWSWLISQRFLLLFIPSHWSRIYMPRISFTYLIWFILRFRKFTANKNIIVSRSRVSIKYIRIKLNLIITMRYEVMNTHI